MPDNLSVEDRRKTMAAIKGKNTKLEMQVRRALHREGFRFRLHRRDLPGTPDVVLPKYRIVVMINGCFWHGHDCARGARQPKSNTNYWLAKIERNRERDARMLAELGRSGWSPVVLWDCQFPQAIDELLRMLGERRDRATYPQSHEAPS